MGRDALCVCRAQAGREPDQGRDHCSLQGQSRRLQGAAPRRVRGGAEDEHGKDPEIQIERNGETILKKMRGYIGYRSALCLTLALAAVNGCFLLYAAYIRSSLTGSLAIYAGIALT